MALLRSASGPEHSPPGVITGDMPPRVVLPGARRTIKVSTGLDQPGDYVMQLAAGLADLKFADTIPLSLAE